MSARLQQTPLGEIVTLDKIESAFRRFWRAAADDGSAEAVLKASTLNLIIYTQQAEKYREVVDQIDQIISHHPGRIIVIYVSKDDREEINARLSAYFQEFRSAPKQIIAEVIMLETGRRGFQHLAGAVLPLLLPDLPVYFWCTFSCVLIHPHLKPLFRYTDRLIVSTEPEYKSPRELAQALETIIGLEQECGISDLNWSKLTPWREAVAQFFDREKGRAYLHRLSEVEIVHSGAHLSTHALLLAGWLSSGLQNIGSVPTNADDATIYYRRRVENIAIKIRRKQVPGIIGLFKVKLIAEENEKAVILTVTAQPDGSLQTSTQIGGSISSGAAVRLNTAHDAQLLCNELDFSGQDQVYLNTVKNIVEYLHES